jgi:large conductance mechanosensitive channel
MLKEFKEFAMRGNVLDMAVGIVLGVAFGSIVNSLVKDILTPPLGLLLGRIDFSNLFITLSAQHYTTLEQAKAAGAPTLNYGVFLNTVINFLIVSFAIFLLVRQVNKLRSRPDEAPAPVTEKECPQCCTRIPVKALRCPNCTSELQAT